MIGWFAHHHGSGHLARSRAVRQHLTAPSALLTSASTDLRDRSLGPVVALPLDDDPPGPHEPVAAPLHYAPVGHDGVQRRAAAIAAWVARVRPSLCVVDVSVEVTMLLRLLGVPTVVLRQHGRRTDRAHRNGLDAATHLAAPFPERVDTPGAPVLHRQRTCHAGWVSRFDERPPVGVHDARRRLGLPLDVPVLTVLLGRGDATPTLVAPLARRLTGWHVVAVGSDEPAHPAFLPQGVVTDPWPHLCAADVVLTAASNNCVAEARASGRRLVVVPMERPFGEQADKAACLDRAGEATAVRSLEEVDLDLLDRVARGPRPMPARGASRRLAEHLDRLAGAGPGQDVALEDRSVAECSAGP